MFDLIIIGSGPGGYATAARAVAMGLRVAIVESADLGGTCLNSGCIPTKALCHSASERPVGSWADAVGRKNAIVGQLRQGVEQTIAGATLLRGRASLTPSGDVTIDGQTYSADRIIIATGSAPATLPIPGAEFTIDSTDILSAESIPSSMIIIGGGVIGLEIASLLEPFGVKVSVVEYCPEILPTLDAEVAKRLRMALKRRGIAINTGAAVQSVTKNDDESLTVTYLSKGKTVEAKADAVLMAVGRRPVIPEGVSEAGVELTAKGFIKVDPATMASTAKDIYAIGDVNGLCMLAHAAEAQGRVALGLDQPLDTIPAAIFTAPECATVGLTEEQCLKADLDFTVGRATFAANGKAVADGETFGLVKVIVERTTLRILGCHICGPHAADLIGELTLAITAGITADVAARAIHAHPTLGESVATALAAALA